MSPTATLQPIDITRWQANLALLVTGGVSIVAGGIVAAVTGPTKWDHGSWVAAFLVLVIGVGQIAVGAGQAHLAAAAPSPAFVRVEWGAWNTGCLTIVAGTLWSSPITVSIGSALLLVALAMSMSVVRGSGGGHHRLQLLYQLVVIVLVVSIPIGIALSWARH